MLRSTIAVIVGFLFTGIGIVATTGVLHRAMPGRYPSPPLRVEDPLALGIELAVIAVFAIAGCWLAGVLAQVRPMRHALILGAIAFAMAIPRTMQSWEQAPAWYQLLNLVLVMPFAWIGGKLRALQSGEA